VGHAFLPVWAAQGTGKVFSTLRVKRGICTLGETEAGVFDAWQRDPIAWPRFFEINTASKEYKGGHGGAAYHYQAWALMHCLWLSDQAGSARFRQLAESLRHTSDLKAVETVLQVSAENLSRKLTNHHRRVNTTREFKFDEAAVRGRMETGPASVASVSVHLADLLSSFGLTTEADREIAASRAAYPDSPQVREGSARAALRRRDSRAAVELYREAIELRSKSPQTYLISAEDWLNQSASRGQDEAGGAGIFADHAIAEVRRALELRPGDTEAYRILARAFYVRPEISCEHVEELARAIAHGDPTGTIRFYQALLFLRLKDLNGYKTALESLVNAGGIQPHVASQARDRLLQLDYNNVVDLIQRLAREGRFTEARAALTNFRANSRNAASLVRRLDQVEQWLDNTERSATQKQN
jgi:hypothetical protein